ncbi:hypothetical protein M406DRAFT_354519 [Cryphonectria parasitica EP155]|uniref:Uncharacterized protein n=1 Tax=Cryphonectria parasitica (strain ATCC 38755 / EP155) TaxID=660469 RepID=A0A9P5CUU4_CRYP1|nr:uncharacterized protein M406DRAFT_354519 [Cryphonectria parasitica EP155]KAF3770661.1 hypothetical protein M406DRAFT_354519 [Cryphonectria parasitica EP155]
MSPSRKSETSSPSSSPKLAHDSGRVRKRTGSFGYRRGRPSTAARVWQSPRMKRNLVRLYYCTTLRTTVIGKILSALASIKYGSR